MIKEEFIAKSPVRILEKSIEGGLKAGNLGVIASRKGIGKTSVLVQLALDKLLRGEKVIHVSFNAHTSYVISWYENIFSEIARRKNLENLDELKDQLVRNRVIMNFTQEGVTVDQVIRSLKAMIVDGGFDAKTIIVDGFDFTRTTPERFDKIVEFVSQMGLEIWYSCTLAGEEPLFDKNGIPIILRDISRLISVLIVLEPMQDHIHLKVVKDQDRLNPKDLNLKLDSRTLLIAEA
jgi:KaiC/GvpD/RAD55 family RecA-like ATPase